MSEARKDADRGRLLSNTKSVLRTLSLGVETMRGQTVPLNGEGTPTVSGDRPTFALRTEPNRSEQVGAGGGGRTLTGSEPHGILSPARLPVSPLRQRMKPTFYRTSSFRAELLTFAARRVSRSFGLRPYTPSARTRRTHGSVRLRKAASLHFTTSVQNEVRGSNDS